MEPCEREFQVYPLQTGLVQLRENNILCDIELNCEGETFPVHKVVLAAASPYFQVMFTSGFKESAERSVTLKETSVTGLKLVLDALYTSKLKLSDETVQAVLSVAHMFQMKSLVAVCEEYILEHFEDVAKTEHLEKLPMELFQGYISNNRLKLPHGEIEVFRAVAQWAQNKHNDDEVVALLKDIRFSHIPVDELVDEVCISPLMLHPECQSLVHEALRFHGKLFKQPLFSEAVHIPRGELYLVVVPGGTRSEDSFAVTNDSTNLQFVRFGPDASTMTRRLTGDFADKSCSIAVKVKTPIFYESKLHMEVPNVRKVLYFAMVHGSLSLVAAGNFLYIFGTNNESFLPLVMRYDSISQEWLDLKPPFEGGARIGATYTKVGGDIIRVGGRIIFRKTKLDKLQLLPGSKNCSKYMIESNSWGSVPDLPNESTFHAATAVDGTLYIAGGQNYLNPHYKAHDSLFACNCSGYDRQSNRYIRQNWQSMGRLNKSRFNFLLEAVGNNLYACGGQHITGDHYRPQISIVHSVEMYSISQNQWTTLEEISLYGLTNLSSVVLDGKIYITGERRCYDRDTDVGTLSCFDPENNTLEHVCDLPISPGKHCTASLIVPRR